MESDKQRSGESSPADTVAMLRQATRLLKELRDRMDRRDDAAVRKGGIQNGE